MLVGVDSLLSTRYNQKSSLGRRRFERICRKEVSKFQTVKVGMQDDQNSNQSPLALELQCNKDKADRPSGRHRTSGVNNHHVIRYQTELVSDLQNTFAWILVHAPRRIRFPYESRLKNGRVTATSHQTCSALFCCNTIDT